MSAVTVWYSDAGDGVPVVLLHAFPLSSSMWSAQQRDLARSCRLITPDQRGFGRTPLGGDPPSLDLVADDVAALLDRLGLDRVVLGGQSMGGYVVMAFLRRHPGRVRAVVLADTKAGADPEPAAARRRWIADEVERAGSATLLLDEVYPKLLGATTTRSRPEVARSVRDQVAAAPPAAVAWAQRAMADRPDSFDTLRALTVPTLVVVGDEDVLSPPADAEAMADAVPDGRLVRLPDAGHLCGLEDPAAFNAALDGFVSQL